MKKNRSDMGSTIMGFANVIAIVYAALMVLAGVITLAIGGGLVGIGYIIGGLLGAYIIYIMMYGFGQLVEDNRAMRENSDRLVRHFLNGEKQSDSFGPGADSFSYQSVAGNKPSADNSAQSDVKYCTNCGTAITPGRDTCWKCGEKL